MMTVVDQVNPWLMPSSTLASTTQPHDGAQMSSSGTGNATSHPVTSTGFLPMRSESAPATKLEAALTRPNATMNVIVTVKPVKPNSSSASKGSTVRSWPSIPPTIALTTTSSVNWAQLGRSPSRIVLRPSVTWRTEARRPAPRHRHQ